MNTIQTIKFLKSFNKVSRGYWLEVLFTTKEITGSVLKEVYKKESVNYLFCEKVRLALDKVTFIVHT